MSTGRTSTSHPLRIGSVRLGDGLGRIGITLCPGKKDPRGMTGPWDRDLDLDLDVVQRWGATAVISLITDPEFDRLRVRGLSKAVQDRHMEWWHLPIRDVSPPGSEFEDGWKAAGEAIRDRLRMGFDVLVHCKGGLGRAGTVAARLLVELGEDSHDAIRKVRVARSGAIETWDQEHHIERCKPVPAIAPSKTWEGIRDRAMGAFLGLAVGDALGTTLEFSQRDRNPRLVDIVGGGPFGLRPGCWTDDTAMALALADSLLAKGRLDCRDLMDRFVAWWRNGEYSCTGRCFDIGNTIRQALERYLRTGDALAGSTDPYSAGNGSLMRFAPVALRYWRERDRLDDVAAQQSRTTHAATEAIDGCRAFATLLADAISGELRRDVLAPRSFRGAPQIAEILGGGWRGKARNSIRSSGYVVHTLEAAIWSVARTGNFRNAVLLAANLAEDADTVAAVTGQLAGAIYGLSGIPNEWLDRIAWKDRLHNTARRLAG
ncbi:MAG: ADP-ribosylglycohydrolase family protein [Bryobacterales bacterium]|nr:ADP-ribosylglycohydrolase family protein [Bryobacterales bacterium]